MISERDYAPLSAACVRSLNDKLYEKRKPAAVEIEKMVKEFAARNNTIQIKRLLKVLGQDFATSQNSHTRKGGLIGLAAIAVGLGKDTGQYTDELIRPILACFCDPDLHVRYYACESLYNVVKIARSAVLPLFTDIFGALSKLACDPEQTVKNATELLDRLMKDIVTESGIFDLVGFMPVLRERIYTKNTFGRQFIISWVSVLDAVPDMDFILVLPEILDGLFKILEDPTLEIKKITDNVLAEFLRNIKSNPSKVDFSAMINTLITHAQSTDELLQLTAISWIYDFVLLSNLSMLSYAPGILTAILPCLAYDGDNRRNIKDKATKVNTSLMKLIINDNDGNNSENNINNLDLTGLVEVLIKHLKQTSVQTKVAVLRWIHCLFVNIPNQMYNHIDGLFPVLMQTLGDSSDEVVQQNLVVLAEIIGPKSATLQLQNQQTSDQTSTTTSSENKYFTKFIVNLLRLFSIDRHLLEERGTFIIRELCVLLSAENIYKILAKTLLEEQNLRFAGVMIQTLNIILLTSSELFELRNKLKDLKSEENRQLFVCLYECWCHNPVATVALCLLGQNYSHACDLVESFENIEVTVEFLTEVDKLVQLIESPIFTYLRLKLLKPERNDALVRTLYGLLMILPQSEAFKTLHRRLTAIPPPSMTLKSTAEVNLNTNEIDFVKLLNHFKIVQEKHKDYKHSQRINMLIERDTINRIEDLNVNIF